MSTYHIPVMLKECLEGLDIKPNGIYVDVTFGGGGHTRAILEKLDGGMLYAFDQDADAKANAEEFQQHRSFTFVESNFRFLKRQLRFHGVKQVDGILADLGVSSHQLDERSRGFSFMEDSVALDMRMNTSGGKTAAEVVNSYSEADLHKVFGLYGEIRNAKTLANAIVMARVEKSFVTVGDLKEVAEKCAPKHREYKYFAQLFQALRIEVNEEMAALEELLVDGTEVLKKGGRFVVMTYHSLEDRLVKSFFQKGKFKGDVEKDFYGNEIKPLKMVTRKPVLASAEELEGNVRARSAKLRIAEKL